MRRRRGFTLVEISIVIVVIALMASVILPRMMPLIQSQRLESFRQDALNLVREAREQAIGQGRPITVLVDSAEISAVTDDQSEVNPDGAQEEAGGRSLDSESLPEGTEVAQLWLEGRTVDASSFRLVFYPTGDATPAVIQFDQGGRIWHILVEGGTGRVTFVDAAYTEGGETRWPAGNLEVRGASS